MFKKTLLLLLCSVLLLTGCSQEAQTENSASNPEEQTELLKGKDDPSDAAETDTASEESDAETGADDLSEEVSTEDTREPETVSLVMNEMNGNEKVSVTMTGLCQYETLESDIYTDTPEDGKVFLVLFLNISNRDNGDDYINPEALSATVDGKEISHCVLFNEPESYETIFDHLAAGEQKDGFIAWQVPSDWNDFQVEYDGWKDICGLTVTANLTPDMLCDPPAMN